MELENIELNIKRATEDVYEIKNDNLMKKIKFSKRKKDNFLYDFANLKLTNTTDDLSKNDSNQDTLLLIRKNANLKNYKVKDSVLETRLNNLRDPIINENCKDKEDNNNIYYLKLENKQKIQEDLNIKIDLIEINNQEEKKIEKYIHYHNIKNESWSNNTLDSNDEDNPNNTYPSSEYSENNSESKSDSYDNYNNNYGDDDNFDDNYNDNYDNDDIYDNNLKNHFSYVPPNFN